MVSVGDVVDSKCGKCKDARRHVVVAVVDGEIVKVECKTCGSQHKHRPPGVAKPAKKTAAKKARKPTIAERKALAASEALRKEWESMTGGVSSTKKYAVSDGYEAGDVVDHAKFGLGYVRQVFPPNKMEVLFEDAIKLMLCNKQ